MKDGHEAWSTIRYAVSRWDTTVRLCVVCLVLQAPLLITAMRR